MKKPFNDSADLALDEDFIRRASALTSGRDLNADDFRVLLETGLQAMEAFADDREGCADPDCVACRIRRGERPRPDMIAAFNAVRALLQRSAEEREAGAETDRQVTIVVSEASLIFMAYLDRLMRQRGSGGLPVAGAHIDLDRPADMEGAERYMAHMVVVSLERLFQEFAEGRHPCSFPRADEPGATVP